MGATDTVTLLTPPGAAAIAVVRLTGTRAVSFLGRHFSRPTSPGRCVHGALSDERGEVIDDPVVVLAPDGDFADVNLHGGAWVVQTVTDLAKRAGFRAPHNATGDDADGELERELLEALPRARTELALRALLAQPQAWAGLRARTPIGGHCPSPEFARELQSIIDDRCLDHLLHPPRVAIVGAPNVGKSTLANQLFAQERSITADLPGTTRDWVGEIANVDGLAVMLVDTPGVRDTTDPLEREAISRSRREVQGADLVVLVLDATRPLDPEQTLLRKAYPDARTVVNKVDGPMALEVSEHPGIRTVASTGQGIDQLRDTIRRRFGCLEIDEARPRAWTDRQRALLVRALDDARALQEI